MPQYEDGNDGWASQSRSVSARRLAGREDCGDCRKNRAIGYLMLTPAGATERDTVNKGQTLLQAAEDLTPDILVVRDAIDRDGTLARRPSSRS